MAVSRPIDAAPPAAQAQLAPKHGLKNLLIILATLVVTLAASLTAVTYAETPPRALAPTGPTVIIEHLPRPTDVVRAEAPEPSLALTLDAAALPPAVLPVDRSVVNPAPLETLSLDALAPDAPRGDAPQPPLSDLTAANPASLDAFSFDTVRLEAFRVDPQLPALPATEPAPPTVAETPVAPTEPPPTTVVEEAPVVPSEPVPPPAEALPAAPTEPPPLVDAPSLPVVVPPPSLVRKPLAARTEPVPPQVEELPASVEESPPPAAPVESASAPVHVPQLPPDPAPAATGAYTVVNRITNVNITFYDCANQGFCGTMYDGRKVYEGAVACSWNLAIGTKLRIVGDPTGRIYVCEDRGALSNTWVDVFFWYPADGYQWASIVGRYGTIEIVETR